MKVSYPTAHQFPRFGSTSAGPVQTVTPPGLYEVSQRSQADQFSRTNQPATPGNPPPQASDAPAQPPPAEQQLYQKFLPDLVQHVQFFQNNAPAVSQVFRLYQDLLLNAAKNLPGTPAAVQQPGYTSLRINYNGDTHEKFHDLPHIISAYQIMSLLGRQAGRDVLNLNAGDNNVGKEPEEYALQIRMLNMVPYTAVTAGNHEFDLDSRHYARIQQEANFPTLLSNLKIPASSALMDLIRSGKLKTMPQIVQDQQGVYGLIGVTTSDMDKVVSKQAKHDGEKPQSQSDTFNNVKAQVDWLRQQGINKIIILSHMGYQNELKLAKTVPGIDVIVGGHSHDVIDGVTPNKNYVPGPTGEPVLLLQGGKNAQYIGVTDVDFDPQGRIIPQQNKLYSPMLVPPHPQAIAWRNAILGPPRQIAVMANPFDANGNEAHSDPVAQFTADAIRTLSGADIAFVRSSEIRDNFSAGPFTDQDLKDLMPFSDPMVRVKLSGQEILDGLSRSAQGMAKHESHPGMLHPSGLTVTMNRETGQVQQASVLNRTTGQWEALNPQKIYTVALGKFAVNNKEFPSFCHPNRIDWNSGQPLRKFFSWGLQRSGAPSTPVHIQDDGRMRIVNRFA